MTAVESRRLIERCRFLEGEVRILNEKIKRSMEEVIGLQIISLSY